MDIRILASSSAGNCYAVSDGTTSLLLECGIRYRDIQRGLGFGITGLSGCLVTHEHQDHSRAAADLMRVGVDIYTSQGTINALGLSGHRLRRVRAMQQFKAGSWTILPFDAIHDAAEPLGFLLASRAGGKLLYFTDSAYCRYRFAGITHLMIETNYSIDILQANVASGALHPAQAHRVVRNHMSIERAVDMLRANDLTQVREIYLLHLSDGNSDAEAFKTAVQRATGKPVYVAAR